MATMIPLIKPSVPIKSLGEGRLRLIVMFFLYFLVAIGCAAALTITIVWLHTSVVPSKALWHIQVTELNNDQVPRVEIKGGIFSGILAVSSVSQHTVGSCIVVVVRAGITRPGLRNGTFNYKTTVPPEISCIALSDAANVIWRRTKQLNVNGESTK